MPAHKSNFCISAVDSCPLLCAPSLPGVTRRVQETFADLLCLFSLFLLFFFFFSPHFVPLTPPLYADVFYAYGEFMSQHSDVIRSVRFTMLMMRQGTDGWKKGSSSFPDHHPFRIFSFARNILFNERGRKISCKFLFVSRVLRRG